MLSPTPPRDSHQTGIPLLQQYIDNIQVTRSLSAPQNGPSSTVSALPDTNLQRVFRYVRRLSGIVGHELNPSTMTATSALNPAANRYLWAHGYQPGSIRLIQDMYERAMDVTSFVDELASAGIPIAEGEYIFSLIRGTP